MPAKTVRKLSSTEAAVRDILVQVGCLETDEIGPNDTFDSMGFDYLDRIEFWMEVEEKLLGGIELAEEDVQEVDSLQQIVAFVDRRRNHGKDGK